MAKGIGIWLRDRREELGLSRSQVGVRTGGKVSPSHLQKVEAGERRPSATVLGELAPVYGTDLVWLLRLAGFVPEETAAPSPEPPTVFTSWEQIERAVRGDKNLTADERRGVLFVLQRVVKPVLEEASKRRRAG